MRLRAQIGSTTVLILFQGWSSIVPHFDPVEFVSLYAELPLVVAMTLGWYVFGKYAAHAPAAQDTESTPLLSTSADGERVLKEQSWWRGDLVDLKTVDLRADEYDDDTPDAAEVKEEEAVREKRLVGRFGWAWWVWYALV